MNNFTSYVVGEHVCTPCPDGAVFDLTSDGALLLLKLGNPTAKEKREFKNGLPQFKFADVDGVIFFLSRFGMLNWMDSPYNRALSQYTLERPTEGYGLALHAMLIDAATGILCAQKIIGLSTQFTNDMLTAVYNQPNLGSRSEYNMRIARIMDLYTTDQIVEMAVSKN